MKPSYKDNDPKGWCGDPKRGAALGRASVKGDRKHDGRLFMRLVRLDSGGYDTNGTYFGHGRRLYWYSSEDGSIDGTVRGETRAQAREKVLRDYPNARIKQ